MIPICATLLFAACDNGVSGDGFRTVTIGSQTWMVEDMQYEGSYSDDGIHTIHYTSDQYNWDLAQKACPSGWRLPSKGDWETLFETVGGADRAGQKLMQRGGCKSTSLNDFGFSSSGGSYWTTTHANNTTYCDQVECPKNYIANLGCPSAGFEKYSIVDKFGNSLGSYKVRCIQR